MICLLWSCQGWAGVSGSTLAAPAGKESPTMRCVSTISLQAKLVPVSVKMPANGVQCDSRSLTFCRN